MIISTLGLEEKYREMLKERFPDKQIIHIGRIADLTEDELRSVEIMFTYGDNMPPELVEKMISLKWVHSGQSGIEAMPKEVLSRMGVRVTNSRGINSVTIAEYVFCMMLNITRNHYRFYEAAKRHEWDMTTHLDEVIGKTMSIFGMGKVGTEIAKRAQAFGMRVIGVDPVSKENIYADEMVPPAEMTRILPLCDVVVICMPLTGGTRNMFTLDVFRQMKPDVIFMNVGRGQIVNEKDLITALDEHLIGHAVLDVFAEEPLPPDHVLWGMEHVYITPHIAGDRQASYQPNMMKILCENLACYPDFASMKNPVILDRGF